MIDIKFKDLYQKILTKKKPLIDFDRYLANKDRVSTIQGKLLYIIYLQIGLGKSLTREENNYVVEQQSLTKIEAEDFINMLNKYKVK